MRDTRNREKRGNTKTKLIMNFKLSVNNLYMHLEPRLLCSFALVLNLPNLLSALRNYFEFCRIFFEKKLIVILIKLEALLNDDMYASGVDPKNQQSILPPTSLRYTVTTPAVVWSIVK